MLFHQLWSNDDARATRVGLDLLAGKYTWLERGVTPLPYSAEDLRPKTMDEILQDREQQKKREPAKAQPEAREERRIA
jgi:hypothetical protein